MIGEECVKRDTMKDEQRDTKRYEQRDLMRSEKKRNIMRHD